MLKELREKRFDVDANWMMATWICALNFCVILLIWHIVGMSCRCCKPNCKREGCCKNHHAFYCNMLVYACVEVAIAVQILWISAIAMGKSFTKFSLLKEWAEYADCVDEYLQINQEQVDLFSSMMSRCAAIIFLVCLIVVESIYSLISTSCFCHRQKKYGDM